MPSVTTTVASLIETNSGTSSDVFLTERNKLTTCKPSKIPTKNPSRKKTRRLFSSSKSKGEQSIESLPSVSTTTIADFDKNTKSTNAHIDDSSRKVTSSSTVSIQIEEFSGSTQSSSTHSTSSSLSSSSSTTVSSVTSPSTVSIQSSTTATLRRDNMISVSTSEVTRLTTTKVPKKFSKMKKSKKVFDESENSGVMHIFAFNGIITFIIICIALVLAVTVIVLFGLIGFFCKKLSKQKRKNINLSLTISKAKKSLEDMVNDSIADTGV